ncbi:MAG: hypothetical protein U0231_15345 [Nitrospiraceae bacterium]
MGRKPESQRWSHHRHRLLLAELALFPIDGAQIITSKQALDLPRIPASLLIIGGGVEV